MTYNNLVYECTVVYRDLIYSLRERVLEKNLVFWNDHTLIFYNLMKLNELNAKMQSYTFFYIINKNHDLTRMLE